MYYVYLLRSTKQSNKIYVGFTADLARRLAQHNNDLNQSTKTFRPWNMEVYAAFRNRYLAEKFEAYLKQGSGHAFAKKHFFGEAGLGLRSPEGAE